MFGRKRLYNPPPAPPRGTEALKPGPPATDEDRALEAIRQGRWEDLAARGVAAVPVLARHLAGDEWFDDYGRERAFSILGELAGAGERSACEALLELRGGVGLLVEGGDRVVDALLAIVDEGTESLRVAAVEALGEIGPERASAPLYGIFESTPRGSKLGYAAEHALRSCGWATLHDDARRTLSSRLVAPLAVILEDPTRSSEWRRASAALARTRDADAVEALIGFAAGSRGQRQYSDWEDALAAPDERLLRGSLAQEALKRLIADPGPVVRTLAIERLGTAEGAGMNELLVFCLRDPSRAVRKAAVSALERRGWRPECEEEEIAALVALEYYGQAAARGLPALDPLLRASEERPWTEDRSRALEAIGEIRDPRAADRLGGLLENADGDADLRLAAAHALAKLGDARGAGELASAFRDEPASRVSFARALAACGAAAGLRDTLQALVERSTPLLRSAEPDDVAAFLCDAAPHLPRSPICIAYAKSSSSDDFPTESERTYDEPGFLLEGKPTGGDVERFASHRRGPGGLDAADFSGRGDEAVWLLPSGSLLRVTSVSYSMHAAASSSHRDWAASAEPMDVDALASDPQRAVAAVIRCAQPLLERLLELDAALAPRSGN
jgi:HEAT repeat protein